MPSRKSAPPRRGLAVAAFHAKAAGTKRSVTEKSLLPVPSSPATFQLSWISAAPAGMTTMWRSPGSCASRRTMAPGRQPLRVLQSPLAKGQRPLSR